MTTPTYAQPGSPNLPDFVIFVTYAMGIDPAYLPADSPFSGWALLRAAALVLPSPLGGFDYTQAVYNLAGHMLIQTAPDQPGRTFFADLRKGYGVNAASFGVVQSAGDQGTSSSYAISDALKNLTLGDLMLLSTPYGRAYLAYAQDYGSVFGLA